MRSSYSRSLVRHSSTGSGVILAAACIMTISQASFAGTLTTDTLAPAFYDVGQPVFAASGYEGWHDFSDNAQAPGGIGQTFTPDADMVLNSITIKGANAGAGGGITTATWSLNLGTFSSGQYWGAPVTSGLYSETFTGDATASGGGGYVTFPLTTPVALTAGTGYYFAVSTASGSWFSIAQSLTDTIASGVRTNINSAATNMEWTYGDRDLTFFLNGSGSAPVSDSEWITNGNESWTTGTNWTPTGVPSGAATTKVLFGTYGGTITEVAPIVVDVSTAVAAAKLEFNKGDGGYVLSGGGSIGVSEGINVILGSHTVSAPISVQTGQSITVAAGATLQLDTLTTPGFGALTKNGDGTLIVDKMQNCSPIINGGIVTLKPGNGQADGWMYGLTLDNGSTLNVNDNYITMNGLYGNGTLNIGAGGRVKAGLYSATFFAGTVTGAGDLVIGDPTAPLQTNNFYGPISHTGTTTVDYGNMVSNQGIKSGNSLTINNGAKLEVLANGGASGVTSISSFTLSGAGSHMELHDNDLVVDYGMNPSAYTDIVNHVKNGLVLLGGAGTDGITSAEVDAQTVAGTMLAVVDDGDPNIAGAITSVSGFNITNPTSSVIVKFTWFGDSNLDGQVDGSDYALIDTGFTSMGSLGGWVFGDYDYSGTVDGSDYALIDTGFISQTGVLPEPASLSLIGLASMSFLRRARRN